MSSVVLFMTPPFRKVTEAGGPYFKGPDSTTGFPGSLESAQWALGRASRSHVRKARRFKSVNGLRQGRALGGLFGRGGALGREIHESSVKTKWNMLRFLDRASVRIGSDGHWWPRRRETGRSQKTGGTGNS